MPAVLPFASVPRPERGDREVIQSLDALRWAGARDATAYRVYFGTVPSPPFKAEIMTTTFRPGPLKPGTTYFWRVDAVAGKVMTPGPVWTFTVAADGTGGKTGAAGVPPPGPLARRPPSGQGASPWRVRIVLVGDSTVTDDSGWGAGFKGRVEDRADCINLARNGRSSKSYRDDGLWNGALESKADYVLIQFGHNDQPGKGPERETDARTTFRQNLKRYVEEARAIGATPVLVTSLVRRNFGADGQVRSDLVDYVEATKAVAAETGAPLVDLHQLSLDTVNRLGPVVAAAFNVKKADGSPDTTHLSPEGSKVFGGIVADELLRLVPALAPYLAPRPATPGKTGNER